MRTILMCCLLLGTANLTLAEKATAMLEHVKQLEPIIYDVKGMGNWKKGSRAGQIRLVITRVDKQDEVFLQWVQWGSKGPETVKSTVVIDEIKQKGNFKVSFIRRESLHEFPLIILGLENLHDKTTSRIKIQVQDLGVYTAEFD